MAALDRLDPMQRRTLQTHLSHGLGRNEIARRMGVSTETVSLAARELGHDFADAAATEVATRIRVARAAERRATLDERALQIAADLLDRATMKQFIGSFGGRDNVYREAEVEQLPAADVLKLIQGYGAIIDRSIKLADVKSQAQIVEGRSAMETLGAALGALPPGDLAQYAEPATLTPLLDDEANPDGPTE